jgi:hypothetical protein
MLTALLEQSARGGRVAESLGDSYELVLVGDGAAALELADLTGRDASLAREFLP